MSITVLRIDLGRINLNEFKEIRQEFLMKRAIEVRIPESFFREDGTTKHAMQRTILLANASRVVDTACNQCRYATASFHTLIHSDERVIRASCTAKICPISQTDATGRLYKKAEKLRVEELKLLDDFVAFHSQEMQADLALEENKSPDKPIETAGLSMGDFA